MRVALRRQLAGHQRRQGQHGALQRQLVPAADELEPAGRRLHTGLSDRAAALMRARGAWSWIWASRALREPRAMYCHAGAAGPSHQELFFPEYRQGQAGQRRAVAVWHLWSS